MNTNCIFIIFTIFNSWYS